MADKRIYQLLPATVTTGKFVPIDKSGNTEAERYPIDDILNYLPYIRCGEETVAAGTTTISFDDTLTTGSDYIVIPIWAATTEGDIINITISNKTVAGFDATTTIACSFVYLAIKKR